MDKVTTPKGKEARERYFTKEEAQALLNEMKKHGMEHYLFTAVGLFTGMRYSEIMNVTGKDINYENGTIRVFGKGDKVRNCEIPKDLLGKIQQVNPGPIDKLITGTVSKYSFRRICNRMGFNKDVAPGDRIHSVSAHTLRHTYGSWLAQQGTPIMIIKELMGHNDINTTMRYAKLAPRSGREEAGKLTNGIVL
jgi:integrase